MAKYVKNTNSCSAIFKLILAVPSVSGYFIYGENSDEMKNSESLYSGFMIGSMFLLIAFFQLIGKNKNTTGDGTEVNKKLHKNSVMLNIRIAGKIIWNTRYVFRPIMERCIMPAQTMKIRNTVTI